MRRCRIVESCTVSLVGMDPGKYCSGRISAVPGLLSYCGCDVPVQCSGFIMHHACCLLYPFVCHQQKGASAGEVVCLSASHLPADSGRNPVCRICRSELSSDRLIGRRVSSVFAVCLLHGKSHQVRCPERERRCPSPTIKGAGAVFRPYENERIFAQAFLVPYMTLRPLSVLARCYQAFGRVKKINKSI